MFYLDKEAVRKIKSRLQEAHSKSCLYGSNPLPDSVLHIEHLSKLELLESLQKKVAQYSGIEISLGFEVQEVMMQYILFYSFFFSF